ncbi:MAG: hypothetical protein U0228_38780 [Myxococcaceae bacterium]
MSSELRLRNELSGANPDAATLERVWRGVVTRETPAPPRRALVLMLAGVAAVAVGVISTLAVTSLLTPKPSGVENVVRLGSDSFVTLEGKTQLLKQGPHSLAVSNGAARFTLEGAWTVSTRHLRIEVASAEFRAEIGDVRDSISVTRGEVKVSAPGLAPLTLRAGQSFSTDGASWKALARSGDFEGAWALLGEAGVRTVAAESTPDERLLLADVAQAGGASQVGFELLREVVDAADAGPERGLAAFTLGDRLRQAGQGAEARRAFERALELPLPPELASAARRAVESLPGP